MKIGIDAREFKKDIYTGLRNILRDILENAPSAHEYVLFCNQYTDLEALPDEMEKVVIDEKITFIWDQIQLPIEISRYGVDIFCSPYIKTPFWRSCPYVCMISDIIPLIMSKYAGIKSFLEKAHFFIYALICGHRASKVITLSEDALERVSAVFAIKKSDITVIYPSIFAGNAPEKKDLIEKYFLYDPYLLYVGNFKPHKNIDNLIDGYALLKDEVKSVYRLILVGGSSSEVMAIEKKVKEKGLTGRVMVLGNMPFEDIHTFMSNASVFVFPSLSEGFGMPPVEAMARGIPVASSKLAPMTESMGDAAQYFDPHDPGNMAKVLAELIEDKSLREKGVHRGLERVKDFAPEKISEQFVNVLANVGREKTLYVSSEFPPVKGGIATQLYHLWRGTKEKSDVIFTAEVEGWDPEEDSGLNIIRKKYPLGGSFSDRLIRTLYVIWNMLAFNWKNNMKMNHCGQVMSAGLGGLLCKVFRGTPYITYVYSADILEFYRNPFIRSLMKIVLFSSEKVVANSLFAAGLVTERSLAKKEDIIVLTPGVNAGEFVSDLDPRDVKDKFGIKPGDKILFTAARLAERKGHDNVIRALSEEIAGFEKVVYVIAGEGPQEEGLKDLAVQLNINERVIFAGKVSDEELKALYNLCDIFIMVPRLIKEKGDVEGFGIVFLEANACAKPVIAGRSGGVPEAVVDGETGILVDPENQEEIKDAILRLLNDEDFARKLGESGRARVLKDFTWQERVEKIKKELGKI